MTPTTPSTQDQEREPAQLNQAVLEDLQVLSARMDLLESRALQENLALSALLDRLEIVVVNVMQFWSIRIMQLNKMTIILGSIALGQLLLVFPQIAQLIRNLL